MTGGATGETERVVNAFAALRASLGEVRCRDTRHLLRDAVRDALDRDAAQLRAAGEPAIIAGTWTLGETIYAGSRFQIDRLRHRDLGSSHLLKRLRPNLGRDPLFRDLLLREGRHQSRLRDPAILPAEAVLRLDGGPGLVLPAQEGPDLAAFLRHSRPGLAWLQALLKRVLDGLSAIHRAGLVHGDLTAANILLPGRDPAQALICDFGLAAEIGSIRSGFDEIGTPGFVPPEAADPLRACEPAQDLFAFGVLLALCLDASSQTKRTWLDLAEALQQDDPGARPTLAQIREVIERT